MTDRTTLDEILAIAYGEVSTELGTVLAELWVRVKQPDGKLLVGARDPVLIHYDVLAGISAFEAALMSKFEEVGATNQVLPPTGATLPAWDSGPPLSSPKAYAYFCEGFGYVDIDTDLSAVVAVFEASPIANAVDREFKEIQSAEYLIAHHTLPAFHDGLRRVLEKMERLGVKPGLKPH